MGEFVRIIDEAIDKAKKEAQEALKKNLEALLNEKYGIILSDDEWGKIIGSSQV